MSSARRRLADERGFTIIEVLASAVIVVIVSVGTFAAFDAASATTGRNKAKSTASQLAQADQERVRSMTPSQLVSLADTPASTTKSVNGRNFTVASSATWVSDPTVATSCAGQGNEAGYLRITSVVVTADVKRAAGTNAVLGRIAKNFVRVYHPITARDSNGACGSAANSGGPGNIQIDAAILSLKHSFTVDNYDCGAPTGTLTVNGIIAQIHRGIVGQGGSSISHGYVKNYNYDDRLKYRSPPYFLDPVQASWRILRQNDQSNAR